VTGLVRLLGTATAWRTIIDRINAIGAGPVYLLCAITALACGALLFRGFRRSRTRLLLWCALFFLALALENFLVFIDLIIVPQTDLYFVRTSIALAGVTLFISGLIWDVE
jgi:hypothetical protein